MTITNAQYEQFEGVNHNIKATIDGVDMIVPMNLANRHYAEILRQIEADELIIADAEQ